MKMKKIKRAIAAICLSVSLLMAAISMYQHRPSSDRMIRMRTLKLTSSAGSCSGVQVKAPSGQSYVLTAAHCRILEDTVGQIAVSDEFGHQLNRKILAEDKESDLLILEGMPGLEGLNIAVTNGVMNHIRTFTHPRGLNTVKSEGLVIQDLEIRIPVERDPDDCNEGKYKQMPIDLGFLQINMCVMDVIETAMDAAISPGSSGGMAVNSRGELVGIMSAGDGRFGYMVRLQDIQRFVGNY